MIIIEEDSNGFDSLAGFLGPLLNTSYFVSAQVPSRLPSIPLTATSQVLALQLGNMYGLVGVSRLCLSSCLPLSL